MRRSFMKGARMIASNPRMRRLCLLVPAVLAVLAVPVPEARAGSKDLLDRIGPLLPSDGDLPSGWAVSDEYPGDHPNYRDIRYVMDPVAERNPGGIAYRISGITVSGYTYLLCSASFEDEEVLRQAGILLMKSGKSHLFRAGMLLFSVWPRYDIVGLRIEDAVSFKYAGPKIASIAKAADDGKRDLVVDALYSLAEELPACPRIRVRAADICLRRLKPPCELEAKVHLDEALKLSDRIPMPGGEMIAACADLAEIHMKRRDRPKAHEAVRKALKSAGADDMESELRLLAGFARLDAEACNAEGCVETLEKAVRLEAGLGGDSILAWARKDAALSPARSHRRFAALLSNQGAPAGFAVHANPGRPKLDLARLPVFIWPPYVSIGVRREETLESVLEAALADICDRQSVSFGGRRSALSSAGKDDCCRFLCRHACRAVVWDGKYDSREFRGDGARAADYAVAVAEAAKSSGAGRLVPDACLAVAVEGGGKHGDGVLWVRAVLFDSCAGRVDVLLAARKEIPSAGLGKYVASLPAEVLKLMEGAMRKAG